MSSKLFRWNAIFELMRSIHEGERIMEKQPQQDPVVLFVRELDRRVVYDRELKEPGSATRVSNIVLQRFMYDVAFTEESRQREALQQKLQGDFTFPVLPPASEQYDAWMLEGARQRVMIRLSITHQDDPIGGGPGEFSQAYRQDGVVHRHAADMVVGPSGGHDLDKASEMIRQGHNGVVPIDDLVCMVPEESSGNLEAIAAGKTIVGFDPNPEPFPDVPVCVCETLLNGHEPGCPMAGR